MGTLIGIDLGTSSFKAAAFDLGGAQRGVVSRPTPWREGPNGAELAPDVFAHAVKELVEDCAQRFAPGDVLAVGVTGMAETSFLETDRGELLPARAWNHRGERALPGLQAFARTGLVDPARTPLVELRAAADDGVAIRAWHGLPDHAVRVLGGRRMLERSLATRTGLVDVRAGTWDPALMEWAGVADAEIADLEPAGTAAGRVNAGRCREAVLTVAGHDHVTAAVGADASSSDAIFDSLGTGEAIIAELSRRAVDLEPGTLRRITSKGINVGLGVDESNVVLFAGLGTGNRFNLLLNELEALGFDRESVLDPDEAPDSDACARARRALPGEAAELLDRLFGPQWQDLRNGEATRLVRAAVSSREAARTLWWAAVECSAVRGRTTLREIHRFIPGATRLVSAGGWLGNSGIRATRERILGPYTVPGVQQAGARGAALLAGLAAELYPTRGDFPRLTSIQEKA